MVLAIDSAGENSLFSNGRFQTHTTALLRPNMFSEQEHNLKSCHYIIRLCKFATGFKKHMKQ